MVNHIGLGEIPDLQCSSKCKKHQGGFLEEVMGVIEVGHVKEEGRVFTVEGHPVLVPSKLGLLDTSIQVSQLPAHL